MPEEQTQYQKVLVNHLACLIISNTKSNIAKRKKKKQRKKGRIYDKI